VLVEPALDGFENMLMLPARDPSLLAGGAAVLDGAALAEVGPVAAQDQPPTANRSRSTPPLLISADPFFNSRRDRLVDLAAHYAVPTMHEWRESVVAGGLISYGPSLPGMYRQVGTYVGKILSGAKPADLPVQQPTRVRAGDQSHNGKGTRPHRAAIDPDARR
jgi:hypothetical protein